MAVNIMWLEQNHLAVDKYDLYEYTHVWPAVPYRNVYLWKSRLSIIDQDGGRINGLEERLTLHSQFDISLWH